MGEKVPIYIVVIIKGDYSISTDVLYASRNEEEVIDFLRKERVGYRSDIDIAEMSYKEYRAIQCEADLEKYTTNSCLYVVFSFNAEDAAPNSN